MKFLFHQIGKSRKCLAQNTTNRTQYQPNLQRSLKAIRELIMCRIVLKKKKRTQIWWVSALLSLF